MHVPPNRTEHYSDKDTNLRIKMDQDQQKSPKAQMFSFMKRHSCINDELALHVACGVIVDSLIQTRYLSCRLSTTESDYYFRSGFPR
uniref:Uncharacterized protein n=1 Tax=Hyaloperonospora arabidopsidis (strain Emoy2) TaxID=559515 RepID=M4BCJ4_HYAAE